MDKYRKIPGLIIATLTGSYSAQRPQITRGHQTHTTSWLGKMERFFLKTMTMASFMSTILTVHFKGQNSISRVQELKISKCCQHPPDTPFWFGLKTLTIQREKAITENTLFNTSESTKERTAILFQCSITKFKMSLGLQMVRSSSWCQASSPQLPPCTMLTANQSLSLVKSSETL